MTADRREVLRGDHLQRALLAPQFLLIARMDQRIGLRERAGQNVDHHFS